MPHVLPALAVAAVAFSCAWLINTNLQSLGFAFSAPCSAVEQGSRVKLDFKLTRDADGATLDSSVSSGPMDFVCGMGVVMPAVDDGVLGMQVGDEKALPVGLENGFGTRSEENVVSVGRELLPAGELKVGMDITVPTDLGERNAVVADLTDTTVTLDFNHPWAGQNLTMTVTLVSCAAPDQHSWVTVETVTPGDGVTFPKVGDNVTVHYTGTLATTGEVFDSSRPKDAPYEFEIGAGQVIKGLDVGVQKLSLGERANLRIPAGMAYAAEAGSFGVNDDVIFDVELLKIA